MNYMKEVAEMLGVELGEEFELERNISDICRYKLTSDGLAAFSPITEDWHEGNKLLVDLLLGSNEIVKIPILDDIEKEYLSAVIKPFRNEVYFIVKVQHEDSEYIAINYRDKFSSDKFYIHLPSFKKGTMYKGMEDCKHYTLEELGL